MNLHNIQSINKVEISDMINKEMDQYLNKASSNGLQNKEIYNLLKKMYDLLNNAGYNDKYLDDLFYNYNCRIIYLANNMVKVNDNIIKENDLYNYIDSAQNLIILNERNENVNIDYILSLNDLKYCEAINNLCFNVSLITIPLKLDTLIIPKPINNLAINCNSDFKLGSIVNSVNDLSNAFNTITFNTEPTKYYGLSMNNTSNINLKSLTYENMYIDLESFKFENNQTIKNIILSNSGKIRNLNGACFRNCSSLASVTIPESVTYMVNSFYGCSSLTSIIIPESVTSLGDYCFYNCSSLTSIIIPKSVTSLGGSCFSNCNSLTSIAIPEGIVSIGDQCFYGCSSLTSIIIPENVTSLGNFCFSNCNSLTSIAIPESVVSMKQACFSYCSNLASVTISEGAVSIGRECFDGCSSLTSIIIPKSVTWIGYDCFSNCSSLASVTIPEGITSLNDYCFFNCSSLTLIAIPESVTSIGRRCFRNCSSLTSVTIPEGVTSIGDNCFDNCNNSIQFKINASSESLANSVGSLIKTNSNPPSGAAYYYNGTWTQFTPS